MHGDQAVDALAGVDEHPIAIGFERLEPAPDVFVARGIAEQRQQLGNVRRVGLRREPDQRVTGANRSSIGTGCAIMCCSCRNVISASSVGRFGSIP